MKIVNKIIVGFMPLVPKSIMARFSARYIAGETKEEALRVVRDLNSRGFMSTLDILGEFVSSADEARGTAGEYIDLLRAIHDQGLDANVSIKLTQLGLIFDRELCFELVRSVASEAENLGNFVRLDMEDSPRTQDTLDIYYRLQREFSQVGCVIQAYLRRSRQDTADLVEGRGNVRLCKGIYVESKDIAFQDGLEINHSFADLLETLLKDKVYTGIATHDPLLVEVALRLIEKHALRRSEYEFQMLLGVAENLRRSLSDEGHRLRVYVPYGSQWYDYAMRRLKENPQLVGYALKGFLTRTV